MIRISGLLLLLAISFTSYAIDTITITRGHIDPMPIAINFFEAENSVTKKTGDNIINVIANDLKRSGMFRPISHAAFIEQATGINHRPLFAAWRQINANLLINGQIKKVSFTKFQVSFRVWDTVLEKELVGETFEVPVDSWRRVAHKIADKIYEKITGDKGYFDTKIVYISETGPYLKRVKRIAIMDQDGENHQFLTDGRNLTVTPRLSHKADKILYLSYSRPDTNLKGRRNLKSSANVYIRDLLTGKESLVSRLPGMAFAPHFSPDGTKALLSVAKEGSTHIYEINLNTLNTIKLTDGNSINTSPSYSPDGSRIVFNSDRNGTRQLYIMNADGSNVERISFGGGSYASPAWSPRGDNIAFVKITRGEGFTLGVMRPDGSGERIITSGYIIEGPSWAPNGRTIMFTRSERPTKKTGSFVQIYSIDLSGYNEQRILTPYDASDPDWSANSD